MAIKVFDVGDRAILRNIDGSSTQDFIMINHPVFFVRSAYDYLKFQQAVAEGAVWKWLLNPKHLLHETLIAQAILAKRITNPLETRYFSQTPYKLSSRQMKFAVRPCAKMVVRNAVKSDMNQLNLNLAHHLSAQEACFDFEVQVRTNAASMPIEDATIEWAEKEAPFVKVARITIPPQIPMIGESCEVASFNPWHSLPEHRPLGAMARVRKEVYEAIARLRLKLNRQL
jgi:catalase